MINPAQMPSWYRRLVLRYMKQQRKYKWYEESGGLLMTHLSWWAMLLKQKIVLVTNGGILVTDLMRCNGMNCPCRETCARFQPFVPTDHPVHWMDKAPFEPDAGSCPEFMFNKQEITQCQATLAAWKCLITLQWKKRLPQSTGKQMPMIWQGWNKQSIPNTALDTPVLVEKRNTVKHGTWKQLIRTE